MLSETLADRGRAREANGSFDVAMSLGPVCRTGYQIRRVFGRGKCLPTIFDRQVTPFASVARAFEVDFKGLFELADLTDAPVEHRALGFAKIHGMYESLENYPRVRREYDSTCALMRRTLASQQRILFVVETTSAPVIRMITDAIALRRDGAPFQVIGVFDSTPRPTWKGNDRSWDVALAEYRIRGTLQSHATSYRRRVEKHLLGRHRA